MCEESNSSFSAFACPWSEVRCFNGMDGRGTGIADSVLNTKPQILKHGNMKRNDCLFAEQINMVLLLTFRFSPEGEDGE